MSGHTPDRSRLRSATGVLAAALVAVAAVAGCSSGSSGPSASTGTSSPGPSGSTGPSGSGVATSVVPPPGAPGSVPARSMRAARYCEVLLVETTDGRSTAEVFNSYPLNDCPEASWRALDATAIAAEAGVPIAVLNGPRYWLMDRIEKEGGTAGARRTYGDIEMIRQASVEIGSLAEAARPYQPHAVDRRTVFVFDAGQWVYELVGPDGAVYVMQSWSQQGDAALGEADLAGLPDRLTLPAGWTYRARQLSETLRVDTTATPAQVLQDDLRNSYTRLPTP